MKRIFLILVAIACLAALPSVAYGFTSASATTFSVLENVTSAKLNTAVGAWATYWNNTVLNGGTSFTIASNDSMLVLGTIVISGTIRMTGTIDLAGSVTPRASRIYRIGFPTKLLAGVYTDTMDAQHAVVDTLVVAFIDTTNSTAKISRNMIQTSAVDSPHILAAGVSGSNLAGTLSGNKIWTGTTTHLGTTVLTASDSIYQAWPYSVIIDSAGNGHTTTIGTRTAPNQTILIRTGTYTATFTISGSNITILTLGRVIINGGVVVTGANVQIIAHGYLLFNGGTTIAAIDWRGANGLLQDVIARTTPGAGADFEAITVAATADSLQIIRPKVTGSDGRGILTKAFMVRIIDPIVENTDLNCIQSDGDDHTYITNPIMLRSASSGVYFDNKRSSVMGGYSAFHGGSGAMFGNAAGDSSTMIGGGFLAEKNANYGLKILGGSVKAMVIGVSLRNNTSGNYYDVGASTKFNIAVNDTTN